MALTHVDTLDPKLFTVAPHTAAVDTFRMTNADGTFVADITDEFIDRLVEHMNERERLTGDLTPLVIGHTVDGQPETEAPPVVGYARNWHAGPLGETGRKAAFFDAWVFNEEVPRVRKFPRRSCEVWTSRYEVDPISLLGATTPARDLGLMRLSREGAVTVESPGDMPMPDDKKPDEKPDDKDKKPAPDPKESGKAKHDDAKIDQILSGIQQLIQAITGGTAMPGQKPEEKKPEESGELSDEEFEKLLAEAGQGGEGGANPPADDGKSRAGEEPVKNQGGYGMPGGMNTHVGDPLARLSRVEEENQALRVQLARLGVKDALTKLKDAGKDIDPDNDALVADLIAMPEDMRVRMIDTVAKLSRPRLGAGSVMLDAALGSAQASGGPARRMTPEDKSRIIRLSREQNKKFEDVARAEGFSL
jgi:hypothetical protein